MLVFQSDVFVCFLKGSDLILAENYFYTMFTRKGFYWLNIEETNMWGNWTCWLWCSWNQRSSVFLRLLHCLHIYRSHTLNSFPQTHLPISTRVWKFHPLVFHHAVYSSVEAANTIRAIFTRMISLMASEWRHDEDGAGCDETWEAKSRTWTESNLLFRRQNESIPEVSPLSTNRKLPGGGEVRN